MAVATVHVLEANAHDSRLPRQLTAALFGASLPTAFAGGLAESPGHGLGNAGDYAVTQNGAPNMSVNVGAGFAFVRGQFAPYNQGVYGVPNDGTVNLAVTTAHGSLARWDLVILQVRDDDWGGGGGFDDARLVVVAGTPAASPADPSLAAYPNNLVLARIVVGAAASSIVTANITMIANKVVPDTPVPIVRTYTSSTTWTKPRGLKYVVVEVQAGGGAGGGAPVSTGGNISGGTPGGGGGYSRKTIAASALAASETVTVGAGGTGVSGADGNAGGSSSFGAHATASGGSPGTAVAAAAIGTPRVNFGGSSGGVGASGDFNFRGLAGGQFLHITGGSTLDVGYGGASWYGQGPALALESNGTASTTPGAGGGGMRNSGASAVRTGGAGGAGRVIVTEYY